MSEVASWFGVTVVGLLVSILDKPGYELNIIM